MMPKFTPEAMEKLQSTLTPEQFEIAGMIIASMGKNKGCLRASKPKVDKNDPKTGIAAYVWREVAFMVSPMAQHKCLPMMADFDLPYQDEAGNFCSLEQARLSGEQYSYQKRQRALANEWSKVADTIVAALPRAAMLQGGVAAWGKALGVL